MSGKLDNCAVGCIPSNYKYYGPCGDAAKGAGHRLLDKGRLSGCILECMLRPRVISARNAWMLGTCKLLPCTVQHILALTYMVASPRSLHGSTVMLHLW